MSKNVVLYVVPNCGLCDNVKAALKSCGYTWTERDVLNDLEARKDFYAGTNQKLVPVVEHEGKFHVRPSLAEIKAF